MNIHCSNCDKVYDSKIENYEDHESNKCTWTNEDKKDYNWGFVSMFLFIGGLFGGMIVTFHTNNFLWFAMISIPTLVLSQLIMYKVWDKKPMERKEN